MVHLEKRLCQIDNYRCMVYVNVTQLRGHRLLLDCRLEQIEEFAQLNCKPRLQTASWDSRHESIYSMHMEQQTESADACMWGS